VTAVPAIRARDLGKRYPGGGDGWALRDLSFEVEAGGAFGIVGDNGAGKSTLLDLLLGVTRPTSGEIAVTGPTAALLELGGGLFIEMTGAENAHHLALLSGIPRASVSAVVQDVESFAELGDFFRRPVRTYSAGMTMRLGFALATAVEAAVVLVDEVLAVGDGYFQRKCIDRLLGLRRRGRTLVVAAHDLHAVRALCETAVWLDHGRPAAVGAASDVVAQYEEHLRRRTASSAALVPGRHGTGEVVIRGVRLTDADGRERAEVTSGGTLRIEVEFETTRPLDSPVMGVALFRDDGLYCYGPNTKHDGVAVGRLDGRYRLVAEFAALPLLRGSYEASVAFYDRDHVYAYAWDHRLYPFRVVSDPPEPGVARLPHRFTLTEVAAR
jgi:ABC-type polysaccharide/polyol phosphate transport system ATPase subunit